jgi:hypothetical protein
MKAERVKEAHPEPSGNPEMANQSERDWVWHTLVLVLGFLLSYLISTPGTTRTFALVRISALLQFLGIFTVVLGVHRARRDLGMRNLLREFADDVSAFIGKFLVHRGGLASEQVTGTVKVEVGPLRVEGEGFVSNPSEADYGKRLSALDQQVQSLVAADQDQLLMLAAAKYAAMEFSRKLEYATQTRPMRMDIVGLIWLSVGVLLPAVPQVAFLLWPIP